MLKLKDGTEFVEEILYFSSLTRSYGARPYTKQSTLNLEKERAPFVRETRANVRETHRA